jgi:hypothetical protein
LGDDAPKPWGNVAAISAAAAKDVAERSPSYNQTSLQRSLLASTSRAKAKANGATPFNAWPEFDRLAG